MNIVEQRVNEILERTVRLESRVVQLGDYVGANLRSKQKIEIRRPTCMSPYVMIDSLDVSVSRILTELRQANLHVQSIDVLVGDTHVFTLFPRQANQADQG